MRNLSLSFRQAHNAEASEVVDIFLVTIEHDELEAINGGQPLRLSSDPTARLSDNPLAYGTVSRGQQYDFLPFQWVAPEEGDEAPSEIQFRILNFDVNMIQLLRSTSTPASVTVEVITSAALNDVEISYPSFDLTGASYDNDAIVLSLAIDSLVTEDVPAESFTPSTFPGLFG